MPEFLEKKLKRRYGAHSKIPYKIMNKIGAMRGSKTTAKGREMERKHRAHKTGGWRPKKGSHAHRMREAEKAVAQDW